MAQPLPHMTDAIARVVSELCVDGATDREIAERLYLTRATVKFHLHDARTISHTHTRTALALWWIRTGRYAYMRDAA